MLADGYKKTEIGVIPIEWEVVKLETVCDVRDGTHDSPKYQKDGIPFITSKHLTDNGVDFSEVNYISIDEHINFSKRSLVENDDILFGMIGTIGKPLIVNYDFEFSIKNVALLKFRDNTKLNNSYTLNLLKSTIIDKQFNKLANGGVQSFIALGMIRSLKIPLPPLKEQEKIADILSTADAKIDAVEGQIQKAETLKKGLLQKLLSEGIGHSEFKDSELGKIPESWEVVKLEKLLENKSIISHLDGNHGGLYPKQNEFVESGTPYLSANMIKGNNIDFSLAKFLTEERASKFRKGVAKDKDVLFAHNATVGPVTLLKTNLDYVILSTTLTYYRCDLEKLNNYYLMNYMKSVYFINQYEKFMKQSTRNQIPITQQRQLYFIIPPLKEQKQIAEILSTADEKLEVLRAKKEKYETLKKGLLQKLLSGEIKV